jgi:hypothetical protein
MAFTKDVRCWKLGSNLVIKPGNGILLQDSDIRRSDEHNLSRLSTSSAAEHSSSSKSCFSVGKVFSIAGAVNVPRIVVSSLSGIMVGPIT